MTKNKLFIKAMSIITIISICICSIGVSADNNVHDVDQFLLEAGFPSDLVNDMSQIQKDLIFEQSNGKMIGYGGKATQNFVLDDAQKLVEVDGTMQSRSGVISSSDLTLSVISTYTMDLNGNILYYTVYPNFVWHKAVKVKNDSFSMTMYPGWEAIPQDENFRLHLMNSNGDSAQYVDIAPTGSGSAGYTYKVPSSVGALQGMYEGYAYFSVEKTTSSASQRITLHYVHDKSSSMNISYSISIANFSINLSSSNSNLNVMSGNYNINVI